MSYPDDYNLDTSEGRIVEDGSTITGCLLFMFIAPALVWILKLLGVLS